MPTINELNAKQLELLRLLYRFRFATTKHLTIALNLNPNNPNHIQYRLKYLFDNEYIGRHYPSQYIIDRKPAEYFLLENGIKALKNQMPDKCSNKVLHSIYKDKIASPSFVAHCIEVFTVYCQFKQRYDDRLRFFTKSQLSGYKHLPKQLPEALVRIDVDGRQKEFFLEVIDPSKRLYKYVAKVDHYIDYSDDGTWTKTTGTRLPAVLFIGNAVGTEIRFQKQAARLLKKHYDNDPKVYTTNTAKLAGILEQHKDWVWRNIEEPEKPVALHDI